MIHSNEIREPDIKPLSPCPKCGHRAMIEHGGAENNFTVYIQCERCGERTPEYKTKEDPVKALACAIYAWNGKEIMT